MSWLNRNLNAILIIALIIVVTILPIFLIVKPWLSGQSPVTYSTLRIIQLALLLVVGILVLLGKGQLVHLSWFVVPLALGVMEFQRPIDVNKIFLSMALIVLAIVWAGLKNKKRPQVEETDKTSSDGWFRRHPVGTEVLGQLLAIVVLIILVFLLPPVIFYHSLYEFMNLLILPTMYGILLVTAVLVSLWVLRKMNASLFHMFWLEIPPVAILLIFHFRYFSL